MNKQHIKDNISILDYCNYKGLEYYFNGYYKGQQSYSLKEHDSLIFISDWYWWNSKNLKGDVIGLVMNLENISFKEALKELEEMIIIPTRKKKGNTIIKHKEKNCLLDSPPKTVNYNKKHIKNVFAYLNKSRHIDNNIIYKLIEKDNILSDDNKNACFAIKDYLTNETVGYEKHGTLTYKRFKGVSYNIPYGLCFNITLGTPKTAIFFESAIDLLSYYQLNVNTLNNVILISMRGRNLNAIHKAQNDLQLNKIILAVDNDKAGQTFTEEVLNAFNNIIIDIDIPKHHKDWNDVLKGQLGASKSISKEGQAKQDDRFLKYRF